MFDGLFDEISWFLSLICIMFIIFVPLGIWKMVEILIWVFNR
jgi:hypothetical protein